MYMLAWLKRKAKRISVCEIKFNVICTILDAVQNKKSRNKRKNHPWVWRQLILQNLINFYMQSLMQFTRSLSATPSNEKWNQCNSIKFGQFIYFDRQLFCDKIWPATVIVVKVWANKTNIGDLSIDYREWIVFLLIWSLFSAYRKNGLEENNFIWKSEFSNKTK